MVLGVIKEFTIKAYVMDGLYQSDFDKQIQALNKLEPKGSESGGNDE